MKPRVCGNPAWPRMAGEQVNLPAVRAQGGAGALRPKGADSMKPLVVRPVHGQHAYAIDLSELGPTYELTFMRRGRGFRVRMKSESGEVVHEPWARVRMAMRVFGWVLQ